MSFALDVKVEIAQNVLKPCCQKAQLAALIKYNGVILIREQRLNLKITTEIAPVARRVWSLIKALVPAEIELAVLKRMNLKKNNIYHLTIINQVPELLAACGLWDENGLLKLVQPMIIQKECCARAYLAGSFLAGGSVNSPQSSKYHLEIRHPDLASAELLQHLMQRFKLDAKIIQRRKSYIVYLKAAEMISDFLRSIGAHNAVMEFEDQRIQRDFTNNFIRLDNCEVANEVKTLKAASKQLALIAKLQANGRFEMLEERVKEIALLRLNHPEASINELCEAYYSLTGFQISKSGMNHRLMKLKELAGQLTDLPTKQKEVAHAKK